MSISRAISEGLRRVLAAPRLIVLLWLASVLCALPASLMMREVLADSLASSLASREMLQGFDLGWYAEFAARAGGFEKTFTPAVSGPGPVLDNLQAWWNGGLFTAYPGLVALALGYAVLWAFLLGGVLDHLARPRGRFARDRFFMAGGRFLPRFLALAAMSGVLYFLIYQLGRRLYRWIDSASRDVTEEKTVLLWVVAASLLVTFLLHAVRMVFDYAKIATVVDARGNVLGSVAAAVRLVLRHPLSTFGVYYALTALGAALIALYAWLAPGAGQATFAGIAAVFLFGQLYLAARLVVRLGLLSSQTSLYRTMLGAGRESTEAR